MVVLGYLCGDNKSGLSSQGSFLRMVLCRCCGTWDLHRYSDSLQWLDGRLRGDSAGRLTALSRYTPTCCVDAARRCGSALRAGLQQPHLCDRSRVRLQKSPKCVGQPLVFSRSRALGGSGWAHQGPAAREKGRCTYPLRGVSATAWGLDRRCAGRTRAHASGMRRKTGNRSFPGFRAHRQFAARFRRMLAEGVW